MAKITITLEDDDFEQVKVNSTPDFKVLVRIAKDKGRELTPAVGYALRAISTIIRDSREQTKDKVKEKFEAGLIPAFDRTAKLTH